MRETFRLFAFLFYAQFAIADLRVVPTPQYFEPQNTFLTIERGGAATIALGPAQSAHSQKMRLAAEMLERQMLRMDSSVNVQIRSAAEQRNGPVIYLWNYAIDSAPPVPLNFMDREMLTDSAHSGQSYAILTPDQSAMWVIGASDYGTLLGAMTVLQLLRTVPQGIVVSGVYIRDYPSFPFRAASDWLLNVEGNRWALDRGKGVEAFARLCEQKLERALRYKINMVLIDGFGWSLDKRFPEYPELMRRLNRYARARGIHLIYGGYGASYGMAYQHGPLYEEGAYLGKVFENRESYPDGPIYRCMGFSSAGREGVDPATLGSCRGNEELNRLKADELRKFVEAVEPGALYIHHEDLGGFNGTERVWQQRCERCRRRWPNDSLIALDGGAGALANGYSALVRAVNSVKNKATGYDAARDCQTILVSPVYIPNSPHPDDWSKAVELWRNIGRRLPGGDNVQVCFREVWPQRHGTARWTDTFNSAMRRAGVDLSIYLFLAGGADNFITDYPFTGAAALNALFEGAKSMYNFNGDFYTEPMEIINAEYTWNTRSTGFYRIPQTNAEAIELWRRYMFDENQPEEMLRPGGIFSTACDLLYGPKAGPIMATYYRTSRDIPDAPEPAELRGRQYSYLPLTFNRAYPTPSHWRHLALDAKTWGSEITNDAYLRGMATLGINRKELHRRLSRRWGILAELNKRGAVLIDQALAADPNTEAVEDLQFLKTSFEVYQPLLTSLEQFHEVLRSRFAGEKGGRMRDSLQSALVQAKLAQQLADRNFPQPIDPVGAEVGSLRKHAARLVESIATWQREDRMP